MANYYNRYPQPQGNAWYDPYSSTPQFGSGIAQIFQNLMQAKEMKKDRQSEEELLQLRRNADERAERKLAQDEYDAAFPQQKALTVAQENQEFKRQYALTLPKEKRLPFMAGVYRPGDTDSIPEYTAPGFANFLSQDEIGGEDWAKKLTKKQYWEYWSVYEKLGKTTELDTYDKKKAGLNRALMNRDITSEQHRAGMNALLGIPKEPAISPTTMKTTRVRAVSEVNKAIADAAMYNEYGTKEFTESYRTGGIHLDLPRKYSQILKKEEYKVANEEESIYARDVERTVEFLKENPHIRSLADVSPRVLRELDSETLSAYLKYHYK